MAERDLTDRDIASIRVGVSEATRRLVGIVAEPSDAVEAQLSMRFALAAVARYGPNVLGDLAPQLFGDPVLLDLARRVEVYREPEQERETWMNWGCVLELATTSGESYAVHIPAPVGSPDNPMDDATLEEKFHRLVDPVLGEARATSIIEVVRHLEDAVPSRDLMPLLVRAGG
jgi:2-methylcitrate dehydratase PrpD